MIILFCWIIMNVLMPLLSSLLEPLALIVILILEICIGFESVKFIFNLSLSDLINNIFKDEYIMSLIGLVIFEFFYYFLVPKVLKKVEQFLYQKGVSKFVVGMVLSFLLIIII